HDGVVSAIAGAIQKACPTATVLNDQEVLPGSGLRPDISVEDPARGRRLLIEVKTPMEAGPTTYSRKHRAVCEKYAGLTQRLKEDAPTALATLCVGALGSWSPHNNTILRAAGLAERVIRSLQRQLALHCIHWSRNSWVEHCTGAPQAF
ncbi:hypothetical protein BOX15_Mlig015271g1, partial [Macrostomum lignano]